MSTDRITGDAFKRRVREYFDIDGRHWFHNLAAQLDRDGDLAERLAAAERERDRFAGYCNTHADLMYERDQEVAALRARAETAERERDEWKARASVHIPVDAATRAKAAQWEAFVACRDHPMRDKAMPFGLEERGLACAWAPGRYRQILPDFPALLARLDALAEAAKPKPEVWRWRWPSGEVSGGSYPSLISVRTSVRQAGIELGGTPVREAVDARGVVTLWPEGVSDA